MGLSANGGSAYRGVWLWGDLPLRGWGCASRWFASRRFCLLGGLPPRGSTSRNQKKQTVSILLECFLVLNDEINERI